ncbi:hypothetical protein ACN3XK_15250 [Actinomadura welshii]
MNPFEDRIVPIGHCRDIATCGQLEETSFFSFANTPAIPPAETARGSVLLVAGRRGNGKTVYGHRLLHEYHARNLRPVDLLRIGHVVKGSPARRHQVLIDLRKAVDPLDSTDLQVDDDIWGDRLCDILNRAGGGLAVRLPGVQQNGATHTDIAWEICQYAMAAQLNDSVLIYEYLTDTWPDDWHKLFAHVEQNHDVTVRDRVLDNLSADDLWTYVEGVMERSPNRRIALAPGVPEELRQTFSRRSLSLSGMHGFMRAAFAAAIAENSPEVSHRHLLTAALDGQGVAA